jgi:hypothetical protein
MVKDANSATVKPLLVLRQSDNVGLLRLPLNAGLSSKLAAVTDTIGHATKSPLEIIRLG